jgi:hypothetical protein
VEGLMKIDSSSMKIEILKIDMNLTIQLGGEEDLNKK